MTDETKIRVRLDTTQAKSEMNALERRGEKAAGRLSERLRGSVGRAFGAAGAGAIAGSISGATVGALRNSTSSGVGDIAGETVGSYLRQAEEWLFGPMKDDAAAARSAREEVIQAFGAVAGAQGSVPDGAERFFQQTKQLQFERERGRTLIESDPRFGGTEINSMLERFAKMIGDEVGTALAPIQSFLSLIGAR